MYKLFQLLMALPEKIFVQTYIFENCCTEPLQSTFRLRFSDKF